MPTANNTSAPQAESVRRPWPRRLLGALAAVIIISAHSQVTLKHIALRLAEVRIGDVDAVRTAADGSAICDDPFAIYASGELKNKQLLIGDAVFWVTDNSRTQIQLDGTPSAVEAALVDNDYRYYTGFSEKSWWVRVALACPSINFTPADGLLALSIIIVFLLVGRQRDWHALIPPPAIVAFLMACSLSLVAAAGPLNELRTAPDLRLGVKELIQYIEVFVIGFVVFRYVWRDAISRRWLVVTLLTMATVTAIVALAEYRSAMANTDLGYVPIQQVDGPFGFAYNPTRSQFTGSEASKNVLATYFLIMVPFTLALTTVRLPMWQRVLAGCATILGVWCTLHAAMLLCAVVGCVFVAALSRSQLWVATVLAGTALVIGIGCTLSQNHGKLLMDTVALHRYHDSFGLLPKPVQGQGMYPTDEQEFFDDWDPWQQKYVELQAALNAFSYSPLTGHGLGGYQSRINHFYNRSPLPALTAPKSAVNYMERDAHSLYAVQATETGIIGLIFLVWILVTTLMSASFHHPNHLSGTIEKALLAGVAGTVVALLVGCWFTSFMTRGIQLIAIALLAIPSALICPGIDSNESRT